MPVVLTQKNLIESRNAALSTPSAGGSPAAITAPSPPPDDTLTRILKLVPGEASAAYTAALAIDPGTSPGGKYLPLTAFVLCAALVPTLIRRDAARNIPPVKPLPMQYFIQLVAFAAWALSIHNPFDVFGLHIDSWIPAIAIVFIPVLGAAALGSGPVAGS